MQERKRGSDLAHPESMSRDVSACGDLDAGRAHPPARRARRTRYVAVILRGIGPEAVRVTLSVRSSRSSSSQKSERRREEEEPERERGRREERGGGGEEGGLFT